MWRRFVGVLVATSVMAGCGGKPASSSDPKPVEPGTAARAKPAKAKPEAAKAKPEPAKAKPEPAKAKPEPAVAKAEPAKAKPEPPAPKPEPAAPKPQPAAPKPEPAAPKPEAKATPPPTPEPPAPKKDDAGTVPTDPRALPAAPVPKKFEQGSWCVFVGNFSPKNLYSTGARLIKAGRDAGYLSTSVFAGRQFENLRWGELSAIAFAGNKGFAIKEARKLKKKKVKAFAARCNPLPGVTPSEVRTPADVPHQAPFAQTPLTDAFKDDFACFGWSPKLGVAACFVLKEPVDWESGSREVALLGSKEPETPAPLAGLVESAQRAQLVAGLGKYGLVAWDAGYSRVIDDKGTLRWADPRVAVTLKRNNEAEEGVAEPFLNTFVNSTSVVTVKCGTSTETLATIEVIGIPREEKKNTVARVRATLFRKHDGLLVEIRSEHYREAIAQWLQLSTLCGGGDRDE